MENANRLSGKPLLPLAIVFLVLCAAPPALAQEPPADRVVTLIGRVVDATSGAGVAAAFVSAGDDGPRTIADSAGAFRLANVPVGNRTLLVERFGYRDLRVRVAVTAEPEPLELRLEPDPVAIEGVTVSGDARAALSGIVLDASTDEPLPWAALWLSKDAVRQAAGRAGRAAADAQGVFRMPDIETGGYFLRVERLGYHTQFVLVDHAAPPEPMEVRLEPDSAVMAGLAIMTQEMRSRRNAVPYTTSAYNEEQLRYTAARTLRQFLDYETSIFWTACDSGRFDCVWARGRSGRPAVYIDELPRHLDEVTSYHPHEIYQVEVISCGGVPQIRVYTTEYMERMARRPRILIPPCL